MSTKFERIVKQISRSAGLLLIIAVLPLSGGCASSLTLGVMPAEAEPGAAGSRAEAVRADLESGVEENYLAERIDPLASTQGIPILYLSKPALIESLQALPLDTLTLSRSQVADVVTGLFGRSLPESEVAALLASVPDKGLPGEQFPTLLASLTFTSVSPTTAQMAAAFKRMGLEEIALFFPLTYTPASHPATEPLFSPRLYQRTVLALAALRSHVGDETFFEIIHTYAGRYRHYPAGTADFVAVVEEVSRQELGELFYGWLYPESVPNNPKMSVVGDEPGMWSAASP